MYSGCKITGNGVGNRLILKKMKYTGPNTYPSELKWDVLSVLKSTQTKCNSLKPLRGIPELVSYKILYTLL